MTHTADSAITIAIIPLRMSLAI